MINKSFKDRLMGAFQKHLNIEDVEQKQQQQKQRAAAFTPPKNSDDHNGSAPSAEPLVSSISALVGLEYLNKDGAVKNAKVTIRRLWKQGEDILIDGYNHVKKAPRLYRSSKIKKIIDLTTNEMFLQPKRYLLGQIAMIPGEEIAGFSGTAKAINNQRHELAALIFLANIDGEFHPTELKMVKDYVKNHNNDLQIDDVKLENYIKKLTPDEDSFFDAIDEILEKDSESVGRFIEFFAKLILADGVVKDKEKDFLAELLEIMEEEGIEINIDGM